MRNSVQPLGAILLVSMAANAWGEAPANPFRAEKVPSNRTFVRLAELHRFEATAPNLFAQVAFQNDGNLNSDNRSAETALGLAADPVLDALPDGPNELPRPVTVNNHGPKKGHPEPIKTPDFECEPSGSILLTEPGGCVLSPPVRDDAHPSGAFSDHDVVMSDIIVSRVDAVPQAGDGSWTYCDERGCDTLAGREAEDSTLVSTLRKLRRALLGR